MPKKNDVTKMKESLARLNERGPKSIKWTSKRAKFTENSLLPDWERDHYYENEV